VVEAWKEQIQSGHIDQVVRDLLVLHYDPTYAASMVRNFTQGGEATACVAANRHPDTLRHVAQALCQQVGA
jgi:tRNA 2-selenouridine synthase